MKKLLVLIVLLLSSAVVFAEVLTGGIEYEVPVNFFGTWRVSSNLIDTDSPGNFKARNNDIWNLYQKGNVITLTNPFSGATSSVNVDFVNNNVVKFSTKGNFDGKILTDTVEITISKNEFEGTNIIVLETLSNVDNTVIKTATATYRLKGEKIAGMSIGE